MSQKSCSATGPASRHSSKQGEEAEKRHSPLGLCLFFHASSFGAFSFRVLSLVFLLSPCYLSTLSSSVFCLLPFTFRASFSVQCRLTPCLCTLPFVLCLPCVIGRRRILHHFVSCTSPFALHFSVLCRLAPCLLHFVSQFLTFHIAPRVGHFPNRPFLSIIAFAATHLPCRLYKIMSTFHCEIRLCLFRAFDSLPGCARPSSGQEPLSP